MSRIKVFLTIKEKDLIEDLLVNILRTKLPYVLPKDEYPYYKNLKLKKKLSLNIFNKINK